jgi:hypothetical protein
VRTIASKADSVLSCMTVSSKGTPLTPAEVYAVVDRLNSSFRDSTELDTNSFAVKTSILGAKRLVDVPYLHPTPGAVPENVVSPPVVWANIPEAYVLHQNYPNPFNPTTKITFELVNPAVVTLKIYNVLGQEVATLVDHQQMEEGSQEAVFNASSLASGVYFYRIIAEQVANADEGIGSQTFVSAKKMMLIK